MTGRNSNLEWTDDELMYLLDEMNRLEEVVEPVSDEEVASIEAEHESVVFSAERDGHQRAHLEELRHRWVAETEKIESLLQYAEEQGLLRDELARQLRLGLDVIFKLELRLLKDIPHRTVRSLADALGLDTRVIYTYLAMPPDMHQMAAVSEKKPKGSELQSWDEAIAQSDMPDKDKEHWKR